MAWNSHRPLRFPKANLNIYSFGSLEGYLDAKIVVQAIRHAGPALTRAALTQALDSMTQVDFGGVTVSFSPTDHQGLDAVYLTILQGGRYKQVQGLLER